MQHERDRARRAEHGGLRLRLSRLAARRARPAVHARRARARAPTTSCSSPASTRTSPPPRCGARSRPSCAARASTTACSRSGTARARASTAPATCSATPTSPAPRAHGGVLALMGDDHTAESSTTAHQSEFPFVDVMIPILNPAGVQEILDYGLYGLAMSRFAGAWVGAQMRARTRSNRPPSSTAALDRVDDRHSATTSTMPPGGLNIRLRRHHAGQGSAAARLQARRHARLRPRQQAQPHRHVRRARSRRSASSPSASAISTCARRSTTSASTRCAPTTRPALYKVGCPWPLEPRRPARISPRGLELDHRRRGEALADRGAGARGTLRHRRTSRSCIGKQDEQRQLAVPGQGRARPQRHRHRHRRAAAAAAAPNEDARRARRAAQAGAGACSPTTQRRRRRARPISAPAARTTPRTVVPEGSRAYAGIGCHYMAQWMDRAARDGFTQMGGEGANWIGEAPFSKRGHVFQNSATAPTTIPASWRSAPRSPPASTSPTRSCSTTRSP